MHCLREVKVIVSWPRGLASGMRKDPREEEILEPGRQGWFTSRVYNAGTEDAFADEMGDCNSMYSKSTTGIIL